MVKDIKTNGYVAADNPVTKPIGKAKAERFAAVEGMRKNEASKALARELAGRGLKGDAYRAEISRAFTKGKPF